MIQPLPLQPQGEGDRVAVAGGSGLRLTGPFVPSCQGDVCITCADEAVPVRVVRLLEDELALVDTGLTMEEVSIALVDAQIGDTILVHAKEAIAVITPGEGGAEGPAGGRGRGSAREGP